MKVSVIDALMGCGKTSWAIQRINEQPEQKIIYITPYLKEVARIKSACPLAKFYEPQQEGHGKLDSLHALLAEGENIVTTHALFSMVTEETRQLLEANGYVLVLDEVMDVLQDEPLKKDDLRTILSNEFAHVEDDGCLVWDDSLYDGRFNDIKIKAANKSLYLVNGCLLMWTFPVSIFHCFKEIFILTYMFHAQIQAYYFKMNDVQFNMLRVYQNGERYEVKEHDGTPDDVSHLQIDIYDGKLNDIGKAKTALSKTWYLRASKEKLVELKNNTYNFFRNVCKSPGALNLWTTFKDYKSKIGGKGYTSGFVSSNMRASNEYKDRDTVAYLCNKFFRPSVKGFFNDHGVEVNEDDYGLSEMVQFLFRAAIRQGKPIRLYVPSKRMRDLLQSWLAQGRC